MNSSSAQETSTESENVGQKTYSEAKRKKIGKRIENAERLHHHRIAISNSLSPPPASVSKGGLRSRSKNIGVCFQEGSP